MLSVSRNHKSSVKKLFRLRLQCCTSCTVVGIRYTAPQLHNSHSHRQRGAATARIRYVLYERDEIARNMPYGEIYKMWEIKSSVYGHNVRKIWNECAEEHVEHIARQCVLQRSRREMANIETKVTHHQNMGFRIETVWRMGIVVSLHVRSGSYLWLFIISFQYTYIHINK